MLLQQSGNRLAQQLQHVVQRRAVRVMFGVRGPGLRALQPAQLLFSSARVGSHRVQLPAEERM